tara:strand:+ start:907 stop:1518 length:612 start_codon:yes stop_codon:yes gene_type:complete
MKFLKVLMHISLIITGSFSLQNRIYKTSKLPQTDLKVISAQQTSMVSKHWFNKIMTDFFEKQEKASENERISKLELARRQRNALEDFSQNYILKNINTLESYFQSPMKDKYLYLAWVPEEINTKSQKDILALIVCNKEEDQSEEEKKLVLKCIITNPSWSGENIESIELKKCLYALESKEYKLDITEFYKEPSNIRFKLDWSL